MIRESKKAERGIERLKKIGYKWEVVKYDVNKNCIVLYNIFDNYNFLFGVVEGLEEYKDFESFKEKIDSWLKYAFLSRAEYEIVCGSLFVENPDHLEKIDVYYQVKGNIEVLCRYIIERYNEKSRKKVGISGKKGNN